VVTRIVTLLSIAIGALALLTPSVHADGAWLDRQPPVQWNQPRMQVPMAPLVDPSTISAQCLQTQRPAESDEDEDVLRAGWRLVGPTSSGWGMQVILATSDFDGMCRPVGYQYFVFQDGLFAGTVSPELMNSRTDGAASTYVITGADALNVTFLRYAAADALCCPSRTSDATYRINRTSGWPVLTLSSVSTNPTG
jgi:hypothetical protein